MLLPLNSIAWTSLLNALANQKVLCDSLYCDICFIAVVWNWTRSVPMVCLNSFHILQKKALLGEKKLVQVCMVGNRKTRIKSLIWVQSPLTPNHSTINTCPSSYFFPGSWADDESSWDAGDPSSIPGLERSAEDGIDYPLQYSRVSRVTQTVKNPPAIQETWVRSLGSEDPLEEGMATHTSILAWRIPWTEDSSRLQFMGCKDSDVTKRLSLSPNYCTNYASTYV